MPGVRPGTLGELLRARAEAQPDFVVFTHLVDGESAERGMTLAQLWRRARGVAAALQRRGAAGERALLLYPAGLEIIPALFGCFLAGVVAVPAPTPDAGQRDRTRARLQGIVRDSGASLVLTTAQGMAWREQLAEQRGEMAWLATDDLGDAWAAECRDCPVAADDLAYLQYTSGSTASPKGVMLTHRNLLSNCREIVEAYGMGPDSVTICWISAFHDLGLLYGLAVPIYSGHRCIWLAPEHFAERPLRWLSAISRYRGTHSMAPNTAYDLAVIRTRPDARAGLDLSSWVVALNGAEPIRAATEARFIETFAPHGFAAEAMSHSFGLAEATAKVTADRPGSRGRFVRLDAAALAQHRVVEAAPGVDARSVADCGITASGAEVVVVDPATSKRCAADEVGELWVRGGSVAQGYWNHAQATAAAFGARIAGTDEGPFYRTGDLGFVRDGHVFVTGRRKDMIIVRGENHYPQDLESALLGAHPALRVNCGVAIGVDDGHSERLMIVAEVYPERLGDPAAVFAAVRERVSGQGLRPGSIVLVAPGTVPKTTSGKLQRQAARVMVQGAGFTALARWDDENVGESRSCAAWVGLPERLARLSAAEQEQALLAVVTAEAAAVLGVEAAAVDAATPLQAYGLDSLMAMDLRSRLRAATGRVLDVGAVFRGGTPRALSAALRAQGQGRSDDVALVDETPGAPGMTPASPGQTRLWLLDRILDEPATYNLDICVRVERALDPDLLAAALRSLVARHEQLRACLVEQGGVVHQSVAPAVDVRVPVIDLSDCSEPERTRRFAAVRRASAYTRFDLGVAPLLRLTLVRESAETSILVLVWHHAVADGASAGIFLRELSAAYAGLSEGRAPATTPAPAYTDHCAQARRWLRSDEAAAQRDWWRAALVGLPSLELPADRPAPARRTQRGGCVAFTVDAALAEGVEALARRARCTPYVVLLTALAVVLRRHSGQDEFAVGTVVSGRDFPGAEEVLGFFVNTLPVRCDLGGDPSLTELLARMRMRVWDVLDHQQLPFDEIVRAGPTGGPLFRVSFVLDAYAWLLERFAGAACASLGDAIGGDVEGTAKFDLSLAVMRCPWGYRAAFEYSADLFEASTVSRLAGHFTEVLRGFVAAADPRVADIEVMSAAERRTLAAWNATERAYPRDVCVHTLFERQVAARPDAVAATYAGASSTYAELDAAANRLAHHLVGLGVGAEVLVGICVEASLGLVVGLLAVLKAGGAYVPLDPAYPRERLAFMLAETRARVLISQAHLVARLPADGVIVVDIEDPTKWASSPGTSPRARCDAENLAYVIYTSGSTGRPKGIGVCHRAIARLVMNTNYVDLGPGDAVAQISNTSFDALTFEVWGALLTGARIVGLSRELALSPGEFAAALRDLRVSATFITTVLFDRVVEARPDAFAAVRRVLFGGDRVNPESVRRVLKHGPPGVLGHVYGPTESTTFATWHPIEGVADDATSVPIGGALANTTLYVLDARLRRVPIGAAGELYIGADGLARGYFGRAGLTADRFVPDPFGGPGGRLYRTGDRVAWRADGALEFLGRFDHQVKIRGFRVELGEIEAVLAGHDSVRACTVMAREDVPGDRRLVAYVVAAGPPTALREHLAARLPEYMVPAAIVRLEALPITPNGKIDRRALPAPEGTREGLGAERVAPRTATERTLAALWEACLGVRGIGVTDDFFRLGGHSLLAVRLMSAIRAAFGRAPSMASLFQSPTIAGLAGLLGAADEADASPVRLRPRGAGEAAFAGLSSTERRLWFLGRLYPDARAYQVPYVRWIVGAVAMDALRASLDALARRHELLRTVYRERDGAVVRHVDDAPAIPLRIADVSQVAEDGRDAATRALLAAEVATAFDLERGPLTRVLVVRRAAEDHVIVLHQHHMITDEWSQGVLFREWAALYTAACVGGAAELAPVVAAYAEYARAEDEAVREDRFAPSRAYWREQLTALPRLELPLIGPLAGGPGLDEVHSYAVPEADSAAFLALARAGGCTRFMAFYALFVAVLARYSGQTDFGVGAVIANREAAGTEDMVGFFTNTVVLRTDLGGDPSFRELLGRAQATALAAYRHQAAPFDLVVQDQGAARRLGETPLYDVSFAEVTPPDADEPLFRPYPDALRDIRITAKDPLGLLVESGPAGTVLRLTHDVSRVRGAAAGRMLAQLGEWMRAVVAQPDLPLSLVGTLGEAEAGQLARWNATETAYPETTVRELFAAQVRRAPNAVAVEYGGTRLTYAELDARAARLARHLRGLGVGPEVRVGLCVERSLELVVGLLAIIKSGGAYVPMDPSHPAQRLAFTLEDARAAVVVTEAAIAARLPAHAAVVVCVDDAAPWLALPATPVAGRVDPDNALYVTYTSGSTGTPKGVVVANRGVVALLSGPFAARRFAAPCRSLVRTLAFDTQVLELVGPLLFGGSVVVLARGAEADTRAIARTVRAGGVTYADLTPALLGHLLNEPEFCAATALRLVNVGGEALTPALAAAFVRRCPGVELWNAYGPTEVTVEASVWPVEPGAAVVPIGRPLANCRVYVLGARGERVPIGVRGELYVAGAGLARGYLDRPGLTASRFVPDPFAGAAGARMYRTGDIVRMDDEGRLLFVGRVDAQVKIRGFRVELGEVEAALAADDSVRACAVLARPSASGEDRLVAYVSPATCGCTAESLKAHLRARLPEPMIPSVFLMIEEMPMTPAGKIDRKALPAPEDREVAAERVAPRTEAEVGLAAIWREVLGVAQVGVHDDFFALGGNSISTVHVVDLAARMGLSLRPQDLFTRPTIAQLAAASGPTTEALDLRGEVVVPPELRFAARAGDTRGVLLTGATGFVGAHLLQQLLQRTRRAIYCLVRGASRDEALIRLRRSLAYHGLTAIDLDRVHVVTGDLAEPRFGLSSEAFAGLAAAIGAVVHSGAKVNHLAPYIALKQVNVGGTETVLRLCARANARLHHVSTADVPAPGEPAPPTSAGYIASKWVAEQMVLAARASGLACSVYRLGLVGGDTGSGAVPLRDYWLTQALRLRLGMKGVPDVPLQFLPADFVGGFIAANVLDGREDEVYELEAEELAPAEGAAIVRTIVGEGQVVAMEAWRALVPRWVRSTQQQDHGFAFILAMLGQVGAAQARGPAAPWERVRRRAVALGLAWPDPGQVFATTLQFLHRHEGAALSLAAPRRRASTAGELRDMVTTLAVNATAGPPVLSVRATDVFVATYPKCGTTWTQQIVHGLRTRGSMDFAEISYAVPFIDDAAQLGVDLEAPQAGEPRAFKTHLPWSQVPKGGRYIYVIRDPRDALLSAYHFYDGWFIEPGALDVRAFCEEMFVRDVEAAHGYWRHVRSWWEQRSRPDLLFLCFEDMKEDLDGAVRRIAAFMGLGADERAIAVATRQASFEFMRAHADQFDERQSVLATSRLLGLPAAASTTKVRAGRVGDGARVIPEDVLARLAEAWRREIAGPLGIRSYEELRARCRELGGRAG